MTIDENLICSFHVLKPSNLMNNKSGSEQNKGRKVKKNLF